MLPLQREADRHTVPKAASGGGGGATKFLQNRRKGCVGEGAVTSGVCLASSQGFCESVRGGSLTVAVYEEEASRRRTVLRDLQKKCIREVNLLKKTVDRRASHEFRVGFRIFQRDLYHSQWEMGVATNTLISLAARYSSMPFSEAKRKLRRETEAIRVIETAMRRLGLLSGSIPRDGL